MENMTTGGKGETLTFEEVHRNEEYGNHYPLHYAARENQLQDLKELLQTTAYDNNPDTLDPSGQTALHLAADRGHVESIKLLLKAGAKNWNAKSRKRLSCKP